MRTGLLLFHLTGVPCVDRYIGTAVLPGAGVLVARQHDGCVDLHVLPSATFHHQLLHRVLGGQRPPPDRLFHPSAHSAGQSVLCPRRWWCLLTVVLDSTDANAFWFFSVVLVAALLLLGDRLFHPSAHSTDQSVFCPRRWWCLLTVVLDNTDANAFWFFSVSW